MHGMGPAIRGTRTAALLFALSFGLSAPTAVPAERAAGPAVDPCAGVPASSSAVAKASVGGSFAVAVFARPRRLLVAGVDAATGRGSVTALCADGATVLRRTPVGRTLTVQDELAADPRAGRAVLASFYAARVSVPDASGRVLRTLAVASLPTAVRVAAAAGRVLVTSYATLDSGGQPVGDGAVTVVDAATLGVRETVEVGAFLLLRAACATIERGTGPCALRTARE